MTTQEIITSKILEKLSQGIIPWKKSWSCNNRPVSWTTQKAYRGINSLLLDGGEYATINQINAAGGKVKKGEKGHVVAFFKWIKKSNDNEETEDSFPLLRYYTVFEINTQCEGMKSKRVQKEIVGTPNELSEKIIAEYKTMPQIAHGNPAYKPSTDVLTMPDMNEFNSTDEYYSTMFHEMVHSTGAKHRLNRAGIVNFDKFGSEQYSKEELIAEIGAAMLCGVTNIETTFDNNVAYIQGWLKALQNDTKLVIMAAGAAQKAVDYIQNKQYIAE